MAKKTPLIVVQVAAALGFAVLLFAQLVNPGAGCRRQALLLGLILLPVSALLAHLLVARLAWPYLRGRPAKERAAWVGLSLLGGLGLVFVTPLIVYPKVNTLRVTAAAERSPQALGSEVWLNSIAEGNRTALADIAQLCRGDWTARDGALAFTGSQPGTLTCRIKSDSTFAIYLVMHPWSGKARVEYNGQTEEVDLYHPRGSKMILEYQAALTPAERGLYALCLGLDAVALGALLLGVVIFGVTRPGAPAARGGAPPAANIAWYFYGLPAFVCWGGYLLAFWPGFLSPDSIDQFTQLATGRFADWHPAFHTMTLWLLTRIWFSPAPVVLAQIALLAGLVGALLARLEERGAPRWANWAAALFLAGSPALGLMLLNPWKDIAYSIALAGLSLGVFEVLWRPAKRFAWVGLGVAAALAALYRHNGSPVAFGTLAALIVAQPRRWRAIAAALALAAALWLGARGPLYQWVGVNTAAAEGGSQQPVLSNMAYMIAAQYRAGAAFSAQDRALLREFRPAEGEFDLAALPPRSAEITNLWLRLTLRNPGVTLRYFQARVAYIFQILQPPMTRVGYVEQAIYENPWGARADAKLPQAQPVLNRVIRRSELPAWDWLFWRNAFWMYLMGLATLTAWLRTRSAKWLVIYLPVLLNALPLALFSGGQIARYILPTLILAPIYSAYLYLARPAQDEPVEVR